MLSSIDFSSAFLPSSTKSLRWTAINPRQGVVETIEKYGLLEVVFRNDGQWIVYWLGNFVQFVKIGNQSTGSVRLTNDKSRHSPFSRVGPFKDTKLNLTLEFCFYRWLLIDWNRVRPFWFPFRVARTSRQSGSEKWGRPAFLQGGFGYWYWIIICTEWCG